MMCYGALKINIDQGRGQYCFSMLHNTYWTKLSAIIVLLHLAYPVCVCVTSLQRT